MKVSTAILEPPRVAGPRWQFPRILQRYGHVVFIHDG
jgi:hypothetical protein